LFFVLEKMVNIALVKTEQSDNKTVKQILKDLEEIFRKFLELRKNNPDKFNYFLWSDDFFDKYIVPLNQRQGAETNGKTVNADELKMEAKFRLALTPEKELKRLTQFLLTLKKIWQSANRNYNEEISRYIVYYLNWILSDLVYEPNNQFFIEQFLKLLKEITYEGIKTAKKTGDINPSLYPAAIHWYIDIVFNRLRGENEEFNLIYYYLDLFDKYFFLMVKYIISEDQSPLFHELVSWLVDRVHIPIYNPICDYRKILKSDPEKYNQLDKKYNITKKIEKLANSKTDLDTKDKLYTWFKKFNELKDIIEPYLTSTQRKKAEELEQKIKDFALSQFKYNNLLEIVFAIGAYCLFKQRPSYIKYLWEYKQPPDADAPWIGHDITPQTLNEVIHFYFKKGLFERKFDFLEGHHGSEKYYKQYFLLLLARVLQENKFLQIENYKLLNLHIYRLSDLDRSIDEFIQLAIDLKTEKNLIAGLGFDVEQTDELFDNKLIPFLKKLKEEANKQISVKHKAQNISPKKIEKFKEEFVKSFYESASLRDIFTKYLKIYENKIEEKITDKKERFGINIVDDKAAFFDEWYVLYVGWGEDYGRNLASAENSYLFDKVAKDCKEISKEEFESTLLKLKSPDDIVIFTANIAFQRFFEDSNRFKPRWYRGIKQLDIKGFGGWYEFRGKSIPVFKTYHQKIKGQILILNKNKIGHLIQLSPLNDGEDKKLVKDIFYINIQAFSENSTLIEQFIKNPPEWLKKIGEEQKQREYLQGRVLIQIFERFEYNKPDDFEGYKLILKD